MRVQLINCTFCENKIPVQPLPGLHLPMLSCGHATCVACNKMHAGDCPLCRKLPNKAKNQFSDGPEKDGAASCNKKVNKGPINCCKFDGVSHFMKDRKAKKSSVIITSTNRHKKKHTSSINDSRFKRPKVDCRTFRRDYRWKITHKLVRQNAFCGTWTILASNNIANL